MICYMSDQFQDCFCFSVSHVIYFQLMDITIYTVNTFGLLLLTCLCIRELHAHIDIHLKKIHMHSSTIVVSLQCHCFELIVVLVACVRLTIWIYSVQFLLLRSLPRSAD